MKLNLFILFASAVFLAGCAGFVNSAQKSLYTASILGDGSMKAYAAYWKDQTNRLGDTPALEQQRSNVVNLSLQVGTSLNLANQSLYSYVNAVGTNTSTQAVVNGLVTAAIQNAGNFAATVGAITGKTNLNLIK